MIKLFTHTDLDGIGCAILAKFVFGNVDIEYCNYDYVDSKVKDYLNSELNYECHITDISVSDELAYEIDGSEKKFQLLDHHSTALRLNKFKWCDVRVEDEKTNLKTCGTEMYYHWLINNGYLNGDKTLNKFVELIRDWDTWRWSTLGEEGIICKQVNDLFHIYGKDKFIDWCLAELFFGTFPKLYESDKLILEIKQKEIDDYVEEKNKQLFTSAMCGKICGFVFAEKYFSELGNRLCQMHPEIDFIAMINMNGYVSYRTIKDNIDLGNDVAQLFGGGGHSKAAGSSFSKDVQLKVIKEIFACNNVSTMR